MAKVLIFGVKDTAELAHYYLDTDSEHEVVGFTLSEDFIKESSFKDLPVYPFETIEHRFKPADYEMFIPMTGSKMNASREKIYKQAKDKGYKLISYISSKASVFTDQIGDNCLILEDNTIQPFTRIGNNVSLWSGNHIGHHSVIEDHVTLTSHIVVSGHCTLNSYTYIGVNATLRDGITIGEGTFISMGASITKSTEPWSVYKGEPATKSNISSKNLRF